MVDWLDPNEIAKELAAAKYLVMICLGIQLCDSVYTLKFDWNIITGRRGARKWPQLLYMLPKLCFWPYLTVTFAVAEPPYKIDCKAFTYTSEFFMGIITCCCSGLLAYRAVAVWAGRARQLVGPAVLVLFIVLLFFWMAGVPIVKAIWIEGPGQVWIKNRGTCTFLPISKTYGIKFIVTVAFDLIILVLTVVGVVRMKSRSRIGTILIEQGLLYFIPTLIMNVILVSFVWADLNPLMSNIMAVPTQLVSMLCATRLFIMLCNEVQPHVVSSSMDSSGFISSFMYKPNGGHPSTVKSKLRQVMRLPKHTPPAATHARPTHELYGMHSQSEAGSVNSPADGRFDGEKFAFACSAKEVDLETGRSGHPFARPLSNEQNRPTAGVHISHETTVTSEPMPAYLKGMENLRQP